MVFQLAACENQIMMQVMRVHAGSTQLKLSVSIAPGTM